jgi:hypothetical protein
VKWRGNITTGASLPSLAGARVKQQAGDGSDKYELFASDWPGGPKVAANHRLLSCGVTQHEYTCSRLRADRDANHAMECTKKVPYQLVIWFEWR